MSTKSSGIESRINGEEASEKGPSESIDGPFYFEPSCGSGVIREGQADLQPGRGSNPLVNYVAVNQFRPVSQLEIGC